MIGKRILLLAKTPLVERLEPTVLKRLAAGGAVNLDRLGIAAQTHERTLALVRRVIGSHIVNEWKVERLQAQDATGKDLVITVGGDGTVLTANSLDADVPLLTVNSDPAGSIGMYTRCTAENFAALFEAWVAGKASEEIIPRLQVRIDHGATWRVLNECLFASSNPAAMTRYVLSDGERRESQRSSGVWVATAAGSTAAIRSAGVEPVDAHQAALLYKVREPFPGRGPMELLAGRQLPPTGLTLMPAMPGVSIFIDGPHFHRPVPPGSVVDFSSSPLPLRLLRLPD
jgi:NAD+ kinase